MLWGGQQEKEMVKPGRYRHYKGKEYEVIGCAKHSETEEEFVVYKALWRRRVVGATCRDVLGIRHGR